MFVSIAALVLGSAPVEKVSLTSAVERALSSHPAMRVAREDTHRARALLEQARAPSLPSLSASASVTLLDGDRVLQERVILARQQQSGNLQLAAPLLNTPRWATWYRASRTVDVAESSTGEAHRQVAVTAARAWLAVLGQHRVVEAQRRAKATAQAHADFARQRREGGVGNALEEARATQELAVSTAQLELAEAQLVRLEEALGVAAGADVPLDASEEEPALAPAETPSALLTHAADARLDVRAARARAEAASDATRVDWLDYLPLLSVVFQPFFQNPASLTQPSVGWQAQAVLTLPLYEGGARYGQARERRAVAASTAAQLEAAVRVARSEVRVALEQLTRADAALAASREAARAAETALELATAAWRAGATTNLDVVDAERRARDAQTSAAVAEDAARQARLELLVAGGRFP